MLKKLTSKRTFFPPSFISHYELPSFNTLYNGLQQAIICHIAMTKLFNISWPLNHSSCSVVVTVAL